MEDWRPTSPLMNRRWLNFAQSAPPAWPAPVATTEESSLTPAAWLEGAQWQATPETTSWPEPIPTLPSTINDGPIDPPIIRRRRPTPGRSPMGPPFLDEAPQDYPSHLAPVPRAPDWEQVVPGPSPWSPLAPTPRATDWGKILSGIECRRTADGGHHECINPGGSRFTVPTNAAFPDYIGPGQPNYHYYNNAALGRRRNEMPGITAGPTPGPSGSVAPATDEGTPNPAAPLYVQIPQRWLNRRIPGLERRLGSASWPVTSYTVVDQFGRPAVINVTHPDHPGSPGIVIRTDETLPSGRHRIRNEGAGVSRLQDPSLPSLYTGPLDWFTRSLWQAQSEDNINRAHRNSRYLNRTQRNFRYGLPLE
jgi:hypothetical protein